MKQKRTSLFLLLALVIVYSQPLKAQLIKTFAGNGFGAHTGTGGYTGDGGLAPLAELNSCTGVTFDGAGNIYIADRNNNVVRKVNTFGIISTFAGNDTAGYSGDSSNATMARLNEPYGVASDVAGNVYIADFGNNVVRVVNTFGMISTYAGTGSAGYSGDGGPATAATLYGPEGVAIDRNGNLFIAEAGNNIVREVLTDGTIMTFAGTGSLGYSGDGGFATDAQLHSPSGVASDIYGNVYIADYLNNVVRKVNSAGIITTFAGNGLQSYSGDGGPAAAAGLHFPSGVSVYGFGNVYIADQGNNTVRTVNTSGIISTFAGVQATNGYTGDGGNANVAELSSPTGVAVDALQRVFIADYDNNVVRVVYANIPAAIGNVAGTGNFNVYPNPSNGSFSIDVPATGGSATISVIDVLGRCVETQNVDATTSSRLDLKLNVPDGSYTIKVESGDNNYRQQVSVIK